MIMGNKLVLRFSQYPKILRPTCLQALIGMQRVIFLNYKKFQEIILINKSDNIITKNTKEFFFKENL